MIDNWRQEDEDPDTESITGEVRTARRIEELRDMSIHLTHKIQLRLVCLPSQRNTLFFVNIVRRDLSQYVVYIVLAMRRCIQGENILTLS